MNAPHQPEPWPAAPAADRGQAAWTAMTLWSLAHRYGNIPAARHAVEALNRYGWPTAGMLEAVLDIWQDVPAAHDGWAVPVAPGDPAGPL